MFDPVRSLNDICDSEIMKICSLVENNARSKLITHLQTTSSSELSSLLLIRHQFPCVYIKRSLFKIHLSLFIVSPNMNVRKNRGIVLFIISPSLNLDWCILMKFDHIR